MSFVQTALQMRGIRGAITAAGNTPNEISVATDRLLREMVRANELHVENIAAAFFTTTDDLTAEFPAVACRTLGWQLVALLCASEIAVPGSLRSCIRVLLLVNTMKEQAAIRHVYLDGAATLRPDLAADQR